jgi:hypothetical protein
MPAPLAESPPIVLPRVVSPPALAPPTRLASFPGSPPAHADRAGRYELEHVSDEALHTEVKALAGRYNGLTAELLAHLAEVDARGIYRERACSSLYTYCVYELRLSEDEAQRRSRAARTARTFPVLFEMLAEGAIHLTGLLLLAPYLTAENHVELLARARFRTKREIERLVAEIAPRPDVPARIEPLGPRPASGRSTWQAFAASLRGPVRGFVAGVGAGNAPPDVRTDSFEVFRDDVTTDSPAPERVDAPEPIASKPLGALRYRVEFTASERYVELLQEARDLLQHQVPDRDVARVHELAMAAFVEQLRKRRQGARRRQRRAAESGSAPERVEGGVDRYVPAEIRREVWQRDGGCCAFADASGRRCRERGASRSITSTPLRSADPRRSRISG